jgi:hypothetical protein
MSVWDLVVANKFEEACAEADREIASVGLERAFNKGNKVVALLKLGRLAEAEAQCERNRQARGHETHFDSIMLGVAQWLQRRTEPAIASWRRATEAKYVDAGGGVESRMLLLFAAKKQDLPDLEKEALNMLKKLPRLKADLKTAKSRPGWPRPLAEFALGHLSSEGVLEIIHSETSAERLRPLLHKHSCQAQFYFGALSQDVAKQKEHFGRAAHDFVPACYIMAEHHLATFELNSISN